MSTARRTHGFRESVIRGMTRLARDYRSINLAQGFLERMPAGAGLDGVPRQCRAHTRKGTPCQREPLPARDYCPSHNHLEETYDGPGFPVEAHEGELSTEELRAAA